MGEEAFDKRFREVFSKAHSEGKLDKGEEHFFVNSCLNKVA